MNPLRPFLLFLFIISSLQAAERPNVLMILADDLGYSDLSCYGSPENETPHLDQLAAEGLRFTDFYAASAVCSPSRAGLMTGRFPVRVGVYSWVADSHKMHLRVEETTTAELLKGAGYSTAHVGKWHLGYDLVDGSGPGPDPGDHGFDHWMATGNNAEPSHENPVNFVKNGVALGKVEGYSCQIVVDEAMSWLDEGRDKDAPFFLNIWFHEPHRKVAAPEEFKKRHPDVKDPAYYGSIENMDNAVGRLIAKLKDMGELENTFIAFTSDNGSYMKGSNDPFSGAKTKLWEGGIREPGIMRWPGKIQPGSISHTPAGIVDILPTICEVTGVEAPKDRTLDGVSLVPLFSSKEITRNHPLYWFYNPSRPVCAIREGDWSLIADPELELSTNNMFLEEYIGPIKETKLINFRLYNLKEDEKQQTDLASKYPERFEEMKKKMVELHRDVVTEAFDWRSFEWEK